jgi:hypothetical protein
VCASDEKLAALAALIAGAIPGLSEVVKECAETMLQCIGSNNSDPYVRHASIMFPEKLTLTFLS